MLIQEWIYLGLVLYGLLSLILTLSFISIKIDEKRLGNKLDFEKRLHNGEILSKDNLF